jgi:uncharacterized repeat protein (TIGR02059 family)
MSASTVNTDFSPTEIVFIDGSLSDIDELVAAVKPGTGVVVLDATQDGLLQMAQALAGRSGIDAIHVLSHGSAGALELGSAHVTQASLATYGDALGAIRSALAADADLLLYGCDVAQGAQGQSFIAALAAASGADVAASTDLTGSALLGGDWTLEAAVGQVATTTLGSDGSLAAYAGTLGMPPTGTTIDFSTGDGAILGPVVTDGQYNSTDIGGLVIDLYQGDSNGSATGYGLIFSTDYDGVAGNIDGSETGGDPTMVIAERDGKEFAFKGIKLADYMNEQHVIQFEGFKDGVSTGTATVTMTGENLVVTESDLPSAKFGDVDKVVFKAISGIAGNGNMWMTYNDIVIDTNGAAPGGDTTAPTVSAIEYVTSATGVTNADVLVYKVSFSEAVKNVDGTDFTLAGPTGSTIGATSVDGRVYTVTVSGGNLAGYNGAVTLGFSSGHDITDNAGNALDLSSAPAIGQVTYQVDNTAPTVASIVRGAPASTTNADSLTWIVTFSEAMQDIGQGSFAVSGSSAGVSAVSDLGGGVYEVTVAGGDLADVNGPVTLGFAAGLADPAGNALASAIPSGTNQSTYNLDNIAPSFVAATVNGNTLVLTYDETLDGMSTPSVDSFLVNIGGGTAATVMGVTIDGAARTVTLTLADPVLPGQSVAVAFNSLSNGGSGDPLQDAVGNSATDLPWTSVTNSDPLAPTVTSASYDAATHVLTVTATDLVAGSAIDVSKLSLTGEGGQVKALGAVAGVTASGNTGFSFTLNAADAGIVNQFINKNGAASTSGTAFNLAAQAGWTSGADADATNAVTASNVAVPTITSAVYNATTGVVVVTGTGFLKFAGGSNDIDVSKFTFVGEDGLTRAVSTGTPAEITSSTSFTFSFGSADINAINRFINKAGTTSTGGAAYNLIANEGWNRGADPAVSSADLTGNTVTATNLPVAAIASVTYNATTGVLVLSGFGFVRYAGANNDIDVGKLSIVGDGASYSLTSADVEIGTNSNITITLNAADKLALASIINKNGGTSTGGVSYSLAAADGWARGVDPALHNVDAASPITASNVVVDTTAPILQTAVVTGGALVLTYNEALDSQHAPAKGDFTVKVGGQVATVGSVAVDPVTKAVTLTLETAVQPGQAVTVSYADSSGGVNAIQDAAGNDAASLNDSAVTNNSTDTLPPVFVSAAVNGSSLVLTYSEALDAAHGPFATAFTVTVGTAQVEVSGVAVDAAAKTVTLTLAAAVQNGQAVTVSYADPTEGNDDDAVQDAAGNDAASLPATGATNNTPATGGTTPPVTTPPVTTPPVTTPVESTVDGVKVVSEQVRNSDGTTSTKLTIPTVTASREEQVGNNDVADIPLAKDAAGASILTAQLPVGYGMTSIGSGIKTAGDALTDLIREIKAHTAAGSADQGQLTGGGNGFVGELASSTALVVQTIVPTLASGAAPGAPLALVGVPSTAGNPLTAIVLDGSQLPAGTHITLDNVDFAALIGAVNVSGGAGSQKVWGDSASQTIFLGAGDDTLHGGGGNDIVGSAGGNDHVYGDDGDDIVFGGDGDDVVDGGAGYDIARFSGAGRDGYSLRVQDGKLVMTDLHGSDGTDTVVDVEVLRFTGAAADTTVRGTVARLVEAAGGTADTATVERLVDTIAKGAGMAAVANGLLSEHGLDQVGSAAFVEALYQNVLGRAADAGGKAAWVAALDNGSVDRAGAALLFADSAEKLAQGQAVDLDFNHSDVATLVRMYETLFGRHADEGGLNFWIGLHEAGNSLAQLADSFFDANEAVAQYGALTDAQFVATLYHTAFDRTGTAGEQKFWLDSLASGAIDRGGVLLGFAESDEMVKLVGMIGTSIETA